MKGSRCARRRARPGLSRSLHGDAESGCISRSTSDRLVYIVSYRRSVSPLQRATSPVAHSARRVYVTLRCPSVCLFHLSTCAAASGGFAAVGPACGRYRSIAARPAHSSTAVSSKCEQCHVCSRRRRLSSDLFDSSNTSRISLRHEVDTLAGRSSRVVSASDCGVRTRVRITLQAVVFIATAAAIYSFGHGLRTSTAVPWSTQPFTLRNEMSISLWTE